MCTACCSSHLLGVSVSAWGRVFAQGGVCPGRCLPRLGCLPRGCLPGGHLPSLSRWVSAPPPLWTEFLTHACENITFAELRLQKARFWKTRTFLVKKFKIKAGSQEYFNVQDNRDKIQTNVIHINIRYLGDKNHTWLSWK